MNPPEKQPITLSLLQQKVKVVRKDLSEIQREMNEFQTYIQEVFEDSKKTLEMLTKK
jgi:hypothetical protein